MSHTTASILGVALALSLGLVLSTGASSDLSDPVVTKPVADEPAVQSVALSKCQCGCVCPGCECGLSVIPEYVEPLPQIPQLTSDKNAPQLDGSSGTCKVPTRQAPTNVVAPATKTYSQKTYQRKRIFGRFRR